MSSIKIDIREENKRQKRNFHPWGAPQTQKIEKWNFKVLIDQKDSGKCPD